MPHWRFRGEFRCPLCGAQTSLIESGTEAISSRIYYVERDERGRYWMDSETLDTYDYELDEITCEACGGSIARDHQELGEMLHEQGLLPIPPEENLATLEENTAEQINSVTEID